jgi:hypothetical protein
MILAATTDTGFGLLSNWIFAAFAFYTSRKSLSHPPTLLRKHHAQKRSNHMCQARWQELWASLLPFS